MAYYNTGRVKINENLIMKGRSRNSNKVKKVILNEVKNLTGS